MSKLIDLTGKRFGRLLALRYVGSGRWLCRCDCGKTKTFLSINLKRNMTRSCGCGHIRKHGKYNTRIYKIWIHMKGRCYNEKDKKYHIYGGKGIKLCDEWNKNFLSFYNWSIENGYKDNLTIDRIDSNCDYCPENCQWITLSENSAKTSSTKITPEQAREIRMKKNIMQKDLAKMYNVSRSSIWHILHNFTHKETNII